MRAIAVAFLLATWASTGLAEESFKVSVLKEPPPAAAAAAIRNELGADGFRIEDDQGKTLADIWLRKAIPAARQAGRPQGSHSVSVPGRWRVARCPPIRRAKGTITAISRSRRASTRCGTACSRSTAITWASVRYRDYSLLLPAAKDQSLALPPRKQLEERSAESAGTSHPAVFLMLTAPPRRQPRRLRR